MGCFLDQFSSTQTVLLAESTSNGLDKESAYAFTNGAAYTLSLSRQGTTCTCKATSPDGTTAMASGTSLVTPRNGADVALDASGVAGQVAWVFVVGPRAGDLAALLTKFGVPAPPSCTSSWPASGLVTRP